MNSSQQEAKAAPDTEKLNQVRDGRASANARQSQLAMRTFEWLREKTPNPSIEQMASGALRAPPVAAHRTLGGIGTL